MSTDPVPPMRRILIVGEFWHGASAAGLAHGLRQLGHCVDQIEISNFFPKMQSRPGRIAMRVLDRACRQDLQNAILQRIVSFPPDILLVLKGSYLDTEFLGKVKTSGVACVNFYPDFSFVQNDFSEDWIASYDLFISTKSFHRERLQELCDPAAFDIIPHGYSSLVHRRMAAVSALEPTFDLCYMGNADKHKAQILGEILGHFRDRRAVVIGNSWSAFLDVAQFPNCVFTGALTGDAMVSTVQASRINIALHFGARDSTGWYDRVSTRTFEIPACGAFMLHIDSPELRTFYEPGEEIAVFATPADAIAQIEYYLEHEDERRAIAEAGWRRCVPAYSYDARCVEIMAAIEARLAGAD